MSQPVHVLHVVGKLNIGGAESRIMDLYRNIDREQIQFDFMQHTSEVCAFQKEVESLGGHVYHVPRFQFYNFFSYSKAWKKFFEEHPEIKVVHGHMTSTAGIYLPIATKAGRFTISHARSAGVPSGIKGVLTRLLRRNLINKCEKAFACSELAAISVYGKKAYAEGKVQVVPNAIMVDNFAFEQRKREEIREQLGIKKDTFVIGHVGRFDDMKNHSYLLDILAEYLTLQKDCCLVLVGEGPLRQSMEEKAKKLQIEEHVIFTGRQSKVADYYQVFDFFLLPSFYEGLPGTAIEAQANGLRGIISDSVTSECVITELMTQKSIELPAKEWAEEIYARRDYERKSHVKEVSDAGFNVMDQVKWLKNFYLGVLK